MFTLRFALVCATALTSAACGGGAVSGSDSGGRAGVPVAALAAVGGGGGGGGGGTSGFYLPFVATSTSGGDTGVFVIPSDALSSTPIFVTGPPQVNRPWASRVSLNN